MKLILNDKVFFYIFLYFNLQFIFDYLSKTYHIEFVNSFNSNINIYYFLYYQLFTFITFILQNYEKIVNKIYFEKKIYLHTFDYLNNYIKNISILWIETNANSILYNLYYDTARLNYLKYNHLLELYGAVLRVIINTYILYKIHNKFLYIIIPYLFIYNLIYHKIILFNRRITKEEQIIVSEKNINKRNLCSTYYNSFIGNYINLYYLSFVNYYNETFKYDLSKTKRDIVYYGSLELFQKCMFLILFSVYIYSKDDNKSNILLLSIFQTITTLIYQFEYILHNYYGYINNSDCMILYNNLKKDYMNYKKDKTSIKHILRKNFNYNISVVYNANYLNERSILKYNINFFIKSSDRIILTGVTGTGKSTFCKIICGHFKNFDLPISEQILYISQNNYINYKYRNLLNIITQNDFNINDVNKEIIDDIFDNIINIDDIKNSFIDKKNYLNIMLNDNVLSGGQEKRIYLIMWIYHLILNISKYKVLILDEPDKGLDYETFYKIIKNIFKYDLFKNLCIIIITHNYKIIEDLTPKKVTLINTNNDITNIKNF